MKHRISLRVAIALLIFSTGALHPARGEVFVLKSGGRIEGEFLNPARAPGSPYAVRTDAGVRLSLGEGLVSRVIVKSELEKQYEELLPTVPNTAEGHWSMAEWCREAGLLDERRQHLEAVIEAEPDHAEARAALGYSLYGSRWLTQEEYMRSQGLVRYRGAWRTKQEVELESRNRQRELAAKQWRVDIRRWFEQVSSNSRHAATAERELASINDPLAAPALAEILANTRQAKSVRLQCLDLLARLPPGLATGTLIKLAMDDRDADVRDRCLDELRRDESSTALSAFLRELKSKDNRRVNRAAICLERLGMPEATLPLIDALVTEHTFIVGSGSSGGGTPLSFSAGGPGGGLGGLSMGGRPKAVKKNLENKTVLAALTHLHQGINFHYDVEAWRKWYIETHTSTNVDLRRDE